MTPFETSAIFNHKGGTRIVPNIGVHRCVVYARCFTRIGLGFVINDPATSITVVAVNIGTRGKKPAVYVSESHW